MEFVEKTFDKKNLIQRLLAVKDIFFNFAAKIQT